MRDYYDYLRKLHATNDYAAVESWNEPEGIGGGLLGFEIAAYQRAAALASGSSGITLMGMGTPHDAENLTKNGFNAVQNAYCVHVHDANAKRGTDKIKRYQDVAGELPLWLTEASTGSFDGDPARPGELTPESARKQALDIPKLYARFLHAGAEKIFYFFLFDHAEERNRHYGLLRRRDLMARPGFNTLAVLGQVLAEYRSIRQLELPDAEGFQIVTRFRGNPAEVTLVWSDNAQIRFPVPPETTEIFDALGRPVTPQDGHVTLSDNPLYLVTPMKMELTAPPSIARPFAETLPPVAGMVRLPDRQKTVSGDFIQLPAMTETTLPFALSNFHAEFLAGTITVSDSGKTLLTLPVELPANGDAELPLVFTLPHDGAGELKIHSDFGKHGAFDQVIRYRAVRTGLRADDRQTAIPNGEDPRRWHANIIKGSTVEFSAEDGWTVFDYNFKQVANTVVGHVWGSPSLNLNVADFPEFRPDALALEIKLLDGAPVQSLGVNLVEEDGATYIGMINLAEAELRHGAELLLPLDAMVNPSFRKRDANGVLDVEKLISLEIPVWAAPNVKMRLAVRNLRWINYNSQGGKKMNLKRTMQTIAAGTLLAGTLQGAVVAEKQAALKNADFSKTKTNGQPEAWNIGNGSNLILKSETTDDGNQFVTLLAENPVKWASIYQASIAVKDFPPLGENQMYEIVLNFRAKTTNVSDYAFGGIDLRSEKAERLVKKDGPNLKGSGEWQDRTVVLELDKIPADARFVLAAFYLNGTGSLSIDDARLSIRVVEKK